MSWIKNIFNFILKESNAKEFVSQSGFVIKNIETIDKFQFRIWGEKKLLIIDPHKLEKCVKYINEKGIKNIEINSSIFGKEVESLEFLYDISFIEMLSILHNKIDLNPINSLHGLKHLSLGGKTEQIIDLTNFPNLESVSYYDTKSIKNLESCIKLKAINIHHYKQKDLQQFKSMHQLESIFFYRSLITSFKGVESIESLVSIDLDNASRLETLSGLTTSHSYLKTLRIYNAKRLTDYKALDYLTSLEDLCIQMGQDIPSIKFLENNKNMKRIVLSMNILDRNYDPLKKIPECI